MTAPDDALATAGWRDADGLRPEAAAIVEGVRRGPDGSAAVGRLKSVVSAVPALGRDALEDADLAGALAAVCGASRALAGVLPSHPEALRRAAAGDWPGPRPVVVADDPMRDLRTGVRAGLLEVAARDLTGRLDMPGVGRALSDLADSAVAAALEVVKPQGTRLAVIALGKWGGRELNYASDIDAVLVHDGDEAAARTAAIALRDLLSNTTADGLAFRLDLDLRPEGAAGPPSRSLDSYRAYWERWAKTWELQALIKARPAAGDPALGAQFMGAAEPFVYPETLGADAVDEIRAMKSRTEGADRTGVVEIKRGVGGIRDVEFAVQLLQLVHGRADPSVRSATTIDALSALASAGYVREDDALALSEAYRWLRDVEHRLQLYDLRQTHELPADTAVRERVAKAMGLRDGAAGTALEAFEATLVGRRAEIRSIHERLFYRPLLEAFADSPAVSMDEAGAERQLLALGFTDTPGTRTAIADLTAGLSRRSRLMQQLLPLMLDWLSESPDPDLGLSQLRLLVTTTVDNAEIVAALRDHPAAAERLCRLLGTSGLLGRLVDRIPSFLPRLGDDEALAAVPDAGETTAAVRRLVASRTDHDSRVAVLHRFRAERLLWIAAADITGRAMPGVVSERLTDLADALVAGALDIARIEAGEEGRDVPAMAVIAMGKWGGRELDYGSDLDALIVHGGDGHAAGADRVAERLMSILGAMSLDLPGASLDLDLRPEGRKGGLTRSLEAYREYWERWAEPWEVQALMRLRPAAGDPGLCAAFADAAAGVVWTAPPAADTVKEIRSIKARIEKERIPAGEDPDFHVKLGPGGMADVEWTIQLLQLLNGPDRPALRTPSTLDALAAAVAEGLLDPSDAGALAAAYEFCARLRNVLFLRTGRRRDSLPTDPMEAARVGRAFGYSATPRTSLREDYRRLTRRARKVVERVFYGG